MHTLRDYQQRTVDDTRAAFASGKRAVLIVAPTGAGKTTIAAEIVQRALAKGRRVLWVAHRTELIAQAVTKLQSLGLKPGVIAGVWKDAPTSETLTVASTQTLLSRDERPGADLLVLDEAHHYASDEWVELAKSYGKASIIGLTATPERADGRGLGAVFDAVVIAAQIKELQEAGHLVPCSVLAPANALGPQELARSPLAAWLTYTKGRPAVVFCQNKEQAAQSADEYIDAGYRAAVVTGETNSVERSRTLLAFETGELDILCNVHVLTEGWDAPRAEVAIIARGVSSTATFLQMVGRVLRPYAGKADAVLLDLKGVSHLHGSPDAERSYALTGKGIRKKDAPIDERFCPVCSAIIVQVGTCDSCGHKGKPVAASRVVGVDLERFASKRAEPLGAKRATLRRWLNLAREQGKRPGWAAYKFKATYGHWPPRSWS